MQMPIILEPVLTIQISFLLSCSVRAYLTICLQFVIQFEKDLTFFDYFSQIKLHFFGKIEDKHCFQKKYWLTLITNLKIVIFL